MLCPTPTLTATQAHPYVPVPVVRGSAQAPAPMQVEPTDLWGNTGENLMGVAGGAPAVPLPGGGEDGKFTTLREPASDPALGRVLEPNIRPTHPTLSFNDARNVAARANTATPVPVDAPNPAEVNAFAMINQQRSLFNPSPGATGPHQDTTRTHARRNFDRLIAQPDAYSHLAGAQAQEPTDVQPHPRPSQGLPCGPI